MRADRLLSMIWLLRAHGGLSTGELARRLEVSRRTILRDVEALSAAGVPVYCQRGPGGGVRLLPGYRTDVTALSGDESRALFAALSSWGADAMGLSAAFVSGVRKLLAAVPDSHRNRTAAAASRIVIDPNGWLPQPDVLQPGEAFATVQAAVFARKKARLDYRSPRAVVQDLVVEPHGLVSAGSDWYLCATSDERMRFLKVARIRTATLLATPCADDAVGCCRGLEVASCPLPRAVHPGGRDRVAPGGSVGGCPGVSHPCRRNRTGRRSARGEVASRASGVHGRSPRAHDPASPWPWRPRRGADRDQDQAADPPGPDHGALPALSHL